jgi:tungstate transport system permease protein
LAAEVPMQDISAAIGLAFSLIVSGDAELGEIVLLSLQISLSAVALATLVGMPLGAAVAMFRFPGRGAVVVVLNALMGLPPVVVGLFVYLMLSRAGPLGELGLLFTPTAMVIAQAILVTPIIAALTRQTVEDLYAEYREQLRSLGVGPLRAIPTLLWDGRFSLLTAVLAGFGRAAAEVGAVIIVGGNINHVTRVMTTTIALETSKGYLGLALGLGFILLLIVVAVNASLMLVQAAARQAEG